MSPQRILGIGLIVVGVLLFVVGASSSESVTDTVSEGLTGRFTDKTMWYLIGGAAAAIVGGALAFANRGHVRSA